MPAHSPAFLWVQFVTEEQAGLTQPEWWVIDTNKPEAGPMPLQKVTDGWSASFRIQYAPPPATTTRGLPHADLIRHAPLRSRAFSANAGVD